MSGVNENISRRNWLGHVSAVSLFGAATLQANGAEKDSAMISTGARVYNIRDFGAKGDGVTLDTVAVQAAIDACTREQGGKVMVPAGDFLIGPVELKSNVTLYIAAGGRLLGTTDPKQYHPANGIPLEGDHTMGDGNVGLIYAANAENVTLEGMGDGGRPGVASACGGRGRPGSAVCGAVFSLQKSRYSRPVFFAQRISHGSRLQQLASAH